MAKNSELIYRQQGIFLKKRRGWLAVSVNLIPVKKDRGRKWPQLENALTIWIDYANQSNYTVGYYTRRINFRQHKKVLNCQLTKNKLRLRNNNII